METLEFNKAATLKDNFSFMENIKHEMSDSHADYFICTINGMVHDVKIVNEEDFSFSSERSVEYREAGSEDWSFLDTVRIND